MQYSFQNTLASIQICPSIMNNVFIYSVLHTKHKLVFSSLCLQQVTFLFIAHIFYIIAPTYKCLLTDIKQIFFILLIRLQHFSNKSECLVSFGYGPQFSLILRYITWRRAAAQLVEALHFKLEGHRVISLQYHQNLPLT